MGLPIAGETFAKVWQALCGTPEEAANMKARSELMLSISGRVKVWNLPQDEAAKRVGPTRPRLTDLMRGRTDKFSLDALVNTVTAAGFTLHIKLEKAA
ncbi:MAG TPA: helix-turn-helix transcriptional regulator [Acetobacteraceae bacterium]|nr:helix-turn-helix transcriptional regulator [Acetobacteraceae bacterium]